uniref:cupin domain-containing protein n=1 Tax=Bradyrhizobium sp. TaxID=376 RepID=UPI001FD9C765|nr:cupin domain-containing protein [Bradyrhizobium sp.]
MKPGVTTEFETTEFAGIAAKIINPFPSPFTVIDMTIKPGFGAPAHISSTEDKLFMVIEGQLKYLIGDKTEIVGPGARVIIPRGVIHGFTNVGIGEARHILVSTPRRHESSSSICTAYRNRVRSTWINCRRSPNVTTKLSSGHCRNGVSLFCPRQMSSSSNYWRG